MDEIKISTEFIKLDQFLKFADITANGADAKFLVQEGYVKVNGEVEKRRGKKLFGDEIIEVDYESDHIKVKVSR
jgi:ribosome-associated protein